MPSARDPNVVDTLPLGDSYTSTTPPPVDELPPGARVGRYVVLRTLGRGGMGVVYAAYDQELDRKIALKLLASAAGADGSQRLLREAQAMAKLSHPNVVPVFDVGTVGKQVFLAMEFIDGETLRGWRDARSRTPREIVAMYVLAGRGLEAAHAAGILHRDFKPDNVVVDQAGRPRVLDFGLARIDPAEENEGQHVVASDRIVSSPATAAPITRVGAMLGTPGYMAPEQLHGERTDARSDVFAFAVSLYEALYRTYPYEGDTIHALRDAIAAERVLPPPARSDVPRAVRLALLRGMRGKPADRFASMTELLSALERATARPRARIAVAGVATAAALVAIAWAAKPARAPVCAGADREIAASWGAPQRAAIAKAFEASGSPHAKETLDRVAKTFDEYGAAWTKMRTESCEATRVRGAQSDEALDLRTACLDQRRSELDATVRLLSSADAKLVGNAVTAARAITDLSQCADVAALRAPFAEPRDGRQRAVVDALRARVADATVLVNARKIDDAGRALEALGRDVKSADSRPLEAATLLLVGRNEEARGHAEEARRAMYDAALAANALRDDVTEAKAWTSLAQVVGYSLSRPDEGDLYADLATRAVERAGGAEPLRADLLRVRARILRARADLGASESTYREALALENHAFGAQSIESAVVERELADIVGAQWRVREAIALQESALSKQVAGLGEGNAQVGLTLAKLALSQEQLGDCDATIATARRALAASNEEDVYHAAARRMLGEGLACAHDLEGGTREAHGAMDELARRYGEGSWYVAGARESFGEGLARRHFDAEALSELESAIAGFEKVQTGRTELGIAESHRALCAARLGRADALDAASRSLASAESKKGAVEGDLLVPLIALGEAELRANDPARAVGALERAVAIAERIDAFPELHADAHFALARALVASHGDASRARALAESAAREYDGARLPELAGAARAFAAP